MSHISEFIEEAEDKYHQVVVSSPVCPVCHSTNIEGEHYDDDGVFVRQACRCLDCVSYFTLEFGLHGVSIADVGEDFVNDPDLRELAVGKARPHHFILSHFDTCTSDYFRGAGAPWVVLAVPVYEEMTYEDLIEGIVDEWWHVTDLPPEGWYKCEHDAVDRELLAVLAYRSLVPDGKDEKDTIFKPGELGDCDDDNCEIVYAYFGIRPVFNEDRSYGR